MKKNVLMKAVVIVAFALALVGIGVQWYNDYHETQLENGAYKYLEHELYGDFSDLEINEITRVGDDRYDIDYTCTKDERNIHGTKFDVEL